MADNMQLKMEILAKARGALHAFDQVDSRIQKVSKRMGEMRSGARMAFGGIGKIMNVGVIAPLKMMAGVATVAGGILAGVGLASLNTAGNFESLQLRLEAVTGSAEKAARIFKETSIYSAATPFQLDDLVDARILLEGIGVSGARSVAMVANAAASMGRNVSDTASLIAGLEAEPLRRLGIQLKTNMGKYQFEFRDKMGNIKKLAAEGADAARQELLSIFESKFGSATGRLAGSLFGKFSTLKDNVKLALAEFGAGMNPAAKDFIDTLTERISKMRDSGVFKEWGEKVGAWLEDGVKKFKAVLETGAELWARIKDLPGAIGDTLLNALKAGAEGLAVALIGALGAMGALWAAIGKMMGFGILGAIADTGILPKKFEGAIRDQKWAAGYGLKDAAANTLPEISKSIGEGFQTFINKWTANQTNVGLSFDFADRYRKNLANVRAGEQEPMAKPAPIRWDAGGYTDKASMDRYMAGDYENIGHTTVNIGKLEVNSNNPTEMERALVRTANAYKPARAGS